MATRVPVKGNLDQALRKFKQKVARDGVPSECKKRECYDKPGVRRRNAKKEGNYELADSIRNELLEKGIVLKDTREGTIYEIK